LRSHAEEWSRYVIARALLEHARQRYEEERQPAVIRRAEGFFRTLTGGRYTRLRAPLGEDESTVLDGSGRQKRPDELSRGTREQLYLALRFGRIQELVEQGERLPVVVDEVLVNFDPVRAPRAAAAFAELAGENQVLVFTCHPWVEQMFRDAAPDAPILRLEGPRRQ
ncbi:MAG: ATP-binding protein, partial [Dehalococcoidia bacterium]